MVYVTTISACPLCNGFLSSPWISFVYKRPMYPRSLNVPHGFPLVAFFPWPLSGFHARTLAALCSFTVLVIVFVALFWTLRVALFGQLFLLMMLRFMSFACTLLTGTRLETAFFVLLWITSTLVPPLLSLGILTLSLTGPEIG